MSGFFDNSKKKSMPQKTQPEKNSSKSFENIPKQVFLYEIKQIHTIHNHGNLGILFGKNSRYIVTQGFMDNESGTYFPKLTEKTIIFLHSTVKLAHNCLKTQQLRWTHF